ncbi:ABC transporter permease [Candidatus Bipolaricaulota bacterium]|nr:ABC transporter permease [Candidatus Bipolaricaulota bacterium]TFH09762.1 MAG: ABC transporter permease [Candidatus Atribacteria bacterium]
MAIFLMLVGFTLQGMVPITLTAVGEIIGQTAGLFNIGLEGILLVSAFAGALGAAAAGPLAGLAIGMGVGAFIGLAFAFVSTYWKGTQMVAGIGINMLAVGFVEFGMIRFSSNAGAFTIPAEQHLFRFNTPFGLLSPIILVALILPFVVRWFIKRTRAGLMLKAAGEAPEAADVSGINVNAIRMLAATVGGALAGLGGAYMSVAWFGFVTKGMSAGRGFIALATVVFSGLNPILALLGGLLFGFFRSLGLVVDTVPGFPLPAEFLHMLPYVVTLLVVSGAIGRVRFPKALGVPYKRE